jgi:hypothetical protein
MWTPANLKTFVFLAAAVMAPHLGAQTLTLTASSSTALFGSPVTLTATLTPAGGTGTVTFFDGVTILGVRPVTNGAASMTTTLLPTGNRKLHAYYGGDQTHSPLTSNTVSVGNGVAGSTTFSSYQINIGAAYASATVVADFNGDGKQDVAIAERGRKCSHPVGQRRWHVPDTAYVHAGGLRERHRGGRF